MPDTILVAVIFVSAIALFFDFVNGFHDAANSIATVVTTRVLTPGQAVLWAAFFNFVAAFAFGTAVARTIGSGLIDAQKTMGIIAGVLFTSGSPAIAALVTDPGGKLAIPFWIVLLCHAAMGLGTLSGGWRIVHTMGSKITKLKPMGGFAAELAGAITLFGSASLGIPVSTTHTITGAIVGVGSMRRLTAVRWGVARNVVWAWVLTIPCTAAIAALIYVPLRWT